MRRAVLVDQHPLWLDAVAATLEAPGVEVVGRCAKLRDAFALIQTHRPELVVTEIAEPDATDWLRRIRVTSPSTRVIVLTASEGLDSIDAALNAGAAAYVIKTAMPDDFTAAVRQAFSQSVFLPNGSDNGSRPEAPDEVQPPPAERIPLTRRELEILRPVAEGGSNATVASALWITEQTVKFHLSNIYRKIGVANRTEAARWAQQNGVLVDDDPVGIGESAAG